MASRISEWRRRARLRLPHTRDQRGDGRFGVVLAVKPRYCRVSRYLQMFKTLPDALIEAQNFIGIHNPESRVAQERNVSLYDFATFEELSKDLRRQDIDRWLDRLKESAEETALVAHRIGEPDYV